MARSIKTMPRSSTSRPSGTCVARTRSPARNAGSRMPNSTSDTRASRQTTDETVDRIVEEAEQVAGPLGAANRKRQQDYGGVDALRHELAAPRVLIGGVDNSPHALGRPFADELGQVLAARRDAGFGLDGAGVAQPEPVL